MKKKKTKIREISSSGFTLVELVMALMVTGIILATVASLAFALGAANDVANDTNATQAQLRYTSLRIGDLIKNCKLISGISATDLVVWRADDNADGYINVPELVFIECGSDRNHIKLLKFTTKSASQDDWQVNPVWVINPDFKTWLLEQFNFQYSDLIPQCSNVTFSCDQQPLITQFVAISFDMTENEQLNHYEIDSSLRCYAGNLLSGTYSIAVTDDD